jgi:hypothetical protein
LRIILVKYKLGKDLVVGDTIGVWWKPNRDTITKLEPYTGSLRNLWDKDGGAKLATFAQNATGMTIEPIQLFEIHHSISEQGIFQVEDGY